MKTGMLVVAMALAMIFGAYGCASPQQVDFELTYDDFMQESDYTWEASVKKGDTIVISLGSNPSTGYSWPERPSISNRVIVKQISHEFIPSVQTNIAGSPGSDVYTFSAEQKGTAIISMKYTREWEEEDETEWTFTATIKVK